MASTGRSSQGSGGASRAGSGSGRGASSVGAAGSARGSQRSQAGTRGANAGEASLGASATASGGPGGLGIGGSAAMSGGAGGMSGSAGLNASTGGASGSAGATGSVEAGGTGTTGSAQSSRQGAAGQSGSSRADAERQVPIGREGQSQNRGTARAQGGGQASAQGSAQGYVTPFGFMRRFGEEMDRLFADFGFGPPGIESQLSLLGWPGSGGQSSVSLNANLPRSAGSVESRGQGAGAGSSVSRPRSSSALAASRSSWLPQVEVLQRGNDLVLRADLPGLRREDVHVEIDDDILTISGERRFESESDEEGVYHSERSYGRFSRSIPLPPGTNSDACEARFTDGVLEVKVPLPQEQSRARRIEIR